MSKVYTERTDSIKRKIMKNIHRNGIKIAWVIVVVVLLPIIIPFALVMLFFFDFSGFKTSNYNPTFLVLAALPGLIIAAVTYAIWRWLKRDERTALRSELMSERARGVTLTQKRISQELEANTAMTVEQLSSVLKIRQDKVIDTLREMMQLGIVRQQINAESAVFSLVDDSWREKDGRIS